MARFGGAVAVASIIAGWALARWPTILPGLTIDDAASGHDTLVWIVVAVAVGAAFTFPSLGLLFGLTLTGRFEGDEQPAFGGIARRATFGPRWATRAAVSCFIAGIGLLTFAEAAWAHAIGVVCLLGFILAAFLAIAPPAVAGETENVRADASVRFFPSRFRQPGDEGPSGLR